MFGNDSTIRPRRDARRVGRREAILFNDDTMHSLFDEVVLKLVEQYYDSCEDNKLKNFVLSPEVRLSKSHFWALVYTVCRQKNIINCDRTNHNLEPFVEHLLTLFDLKYVGDRSAVQKKVKEIEDLGITSLKPIDEYRVKDRGKVEKGRKALCEVRKCLEEYEEGKGMKSLSKT